MIQWVPVIFFRFLLFLLAGILIQFYFNFYTSGLIVFLLLSIGIYFLLLAFSGPKHRITLSPWMGGLAFLVLFLTGMLCTYQAKENNFSDHLSKFSVMEAYIAGIESEIQEKPGSYKMELRVRKIKTKGKWRSARGRIVLFIRKSEKSRPFSLFYGDRLLIPGSPQEVNATLNPDAFDYKKYLALRNIYHQHWIKNDQFKLLEHRPTNMLIFWALNVRTYCNQLFEKFIDFPVEKSIAKALVLGIRDRMDTEVLQAYAASGTVHVLAVSGMHVGLIYWILSFLLGWLKKEKKGNVLFTVLILLILWFYAFVTGLSASVLRATMMFSFVVLAQSSGRKNVMYNTLAASAFLLLLYQPLLIFDVGFQLSYLAVLGIVYFYPRMYRSIELDNRFLDFIWSLLCLSVSAQLATFPLSMFYFHQFPNYFILANLLIVPLSSMALYLGLGFLLFNFVPGLNVALAFLLKWSLWWMNYITFLLEDLPFSLTKNLYFSVIETFLIYFFMFFLILLFYQRRFIWLVLSFICVGAVCIQQSLRLVREASRQTLAVFYTFRFSNLNLIDGKVSYLLADSALLTHQNQLNYQFQNHWIRRKISKQHLLAFKKIDPQHLPYPLSQKQGMTLLSWKGKLVMILHQHVKDLDFSAMIRPDILILQKNAIKNLDELDQKIDPQKIILDASNSFFHCKNITRQAVKRKIPCHWVTEAGAFIWEER